MVARYAEIVTNDELRERHEALAQTVELIASMQRENEERFRRNDQILVERFDRVARTFEAALDSIKRLETIARGA